MKNTQLWKPTKFIITRRGCRSSPEPNAVTIGSRFITGIVAKVYEKAIREYARGRLLDLGCGKVPLYYIYKDYVSENICIDWAKSGCKSPYVDIEADLNQGIPLNGEGFDTILATDLLEHLHAPDKIWKDMTRLLKPQGKIIIGVPFFYWIHEEPYDYYRYTEHRLRMFCDSNNLKVISLEPYGGPPEIIIDIIAKLISSHKFLSSVHLFLSNLFIKAFRRRKTLENSSRKWPLGYCLIAQKY